MPSKRCVSRRVSLVTPGSGTVISATATAISATAATSTMAMRSTEADLAAEVQGFTALRRLIFSRGLAPVRSVGLITAETSEAFPPAGGRVLEVDPMEAVSMVAGVGDHRDWANPPQDVSETQQPLTTPFSTPFPPSL